MEPLGTIVRDYENWRRSQSGKPAKGALRDYWRQRDPKQGQRPDYLLWRQTLGGESPLEKRQDPVDLALRALRAADPLVHWAGLALAPLLLEGKPTLNAGRREELSKAVLSRSGRGSSPLPALQQCPHSSALVAWICRSLAEGTPAMLKELGDLFAAAKPDWKPGRGADLEFLKTEAWMPVPRGLIRTWLVKGITQLIRKTHAPEAAAAAPNKLSVQDAAAWHQTAWMIMRDARPPQGSARAEELEVLLDAAAAARLADDPHEAARLTALALNLATPQMPAPFLQRCRVAAWMLAETGLSAPESLRVKLDDLPFPGEPPASDKGQEVARQFHDAADASQMRLGQEAAEDPDWQRLRAAGVALHHPLAALAWIGKKAQSYLIKKQQDLLQSAAVLAARHQRLGTWGKILAQWPGSAENVLAYAQALRQSIRRMPVLRDSEVWRDCTADLRTAWGKLEADAIHDPEAVFMLHETLLDREVTTLRCLPEDLRMPALRHLHSRRAPSPLVQALEAEPKLMQSLAHQRTLELWALAAEMRERPEQAAVAWISLTGRGDAASGKYSWLVQGPAGRLLCQGRLRPAGAGQLDPAPLVTELAEAVAKVCAAPEWVLLSIDQGWRGLPWPALLRGAGLTASVATIPSWEWAFRVMRENASAKEISPEFLLPQGSAISGKPDLPQGSASGPLAQACILLAGAEPSDANTRWTLVGEPAEAEERPGSRRSLSIGEHPRVISYGPLLQTDSLNADLIRLSLAQATRCVISPAGVLAPEQRDNALETLLLGAPLRIPFAERLRALTGGHLNTWHITGLPWGPGQETPAKS